MRKLYFILFISLVLFGCEKGSMVDDINDLVAIETGLLRIECSECEIKYVINEKEFNNSVKDGNGDFPFSYVLGYNIKTQILSKKDQDIRLLIMDGYGQVISNQLTSFTAGEVRNGSFDLREK